MFLTGYTTRNYSNQRKKSLVGLAAAPADNLECEYFNKKWFKNGDFKILTKPNLTIHFPNPAGGPGATLKMPGARGLP